MYSASVRKLFNGVSVQFPRLTWRFISADYEEGLVEEWERKSGRVLERISDPEN